MTRSLPDLDQGLSTAQRRTVTFAHRTILACVRRPRVAKSRVTAVFTASPWLLETADLDDAAYRASFVPALVGAVPGLRARWRAALVRAVWLDHRDHAGPARLQLLDLVAAELAESGDLAVALDAVIGRTNIAPELVRGHARVLFEAMAAFTRHLPASAAAG